MAEIQRHSSHRANALSAGLRFYFYPHLFSLIDRRRTELILENLKGPSVLDAGSGKGNISLCAWRAGHTVTAVDLSESSIGDAAFLFKYEDADIPIIFAPLTALPIADEKFDSVICTGVIEHISEAVTALGELTRVLKKDGRLIVSVPNPMTFGLFYDHMVTRLVPEKKQSPFAYKRYFKITAEEISRFGWDNKIIFSHCQNFTFKKFQRFLHAGGLTVKKIAHWRFLNPYLRSLGTLLGFGPIKPLEKLDSAMARFIPHQLASEWLFVCKKTNPEVKQ